MIVNYIKEMGVDTDLFAISTKAGKDEMFEITPNDLIRLRITNNGYTHPVWSIESLSGFLYLRGVRDTVYGVNKIIFHCDRSEGVLLVVIFDPQGRDEEVMAHRAHSLVVDGKQEAIKPVHTRIENRWFNAAYRLSPEQIKSIQRSSKIGMIVRSSYQASIFLGFDRFDFSEASVKFNGLLSNCGYR